MQLLLTCTPPYKKALTIILLAISPHNPQLWMSLPLSPISTTLGNYSAWQQPFWERISKGHRTDLLNFEQECTHIETHIHMHIQKARHAYTLWLMLMPLCISHQTHTVCMSMQGTREAETVSLKSNHPHLHILTLMSPTDHTHSHTSMLTPSPHTKTLCLSVTHTPLLLLSIYTARQTSRYTMQSNCLLNVAMVCLSVKYTPVLPLCTHTHTQGHKVWSGNDIMHYDIILAYKQAHKYSHGIRQLPAIAPSYTSSHIASIQEIEIHGFWLISTFGCIMEGRG